MASRIKLHRELVSVLGSGNVYYQPPESIKLKYPCIIYKKNKIKARYADNKIYALTNEYAVTVVDKDPDSEIAENLLKHFPFCRHDRTFESENLHHDVLTLHY